MRVGIVHYGMGNILSVFNALVMIGVEPKLCSDPTEMTQVDRLIFPGVGAFCSCMKNLHESGLIDSLQEEVLEKRKPILGVCLGMQAMARQSFEGGKTKGLGWFDADVVRLEPADRTLRVPHVGWDQLSACTENVLFEGIPEDADFYFVHSYFMKCPNQRDVEATCDYGEKMTAAVHKQNIFAVQFHPEKSQGHGLRVLQNFLKWEG